MVFMTNTGAKKKHDELLERQQQPVSPGRGGLHLENLINAFVHWPHLLGCSSCQLWFPLKDLGAHKKQALVTGGDGPQMRGQFTAFVLALAGAIALVWLKANETNNGGYISLPSVLAVYMHMSMEHTLIHKNHVIPSSPSLLSGNTWAACRT